MSRNLRRVFLVLFANLFVAIAIWSPASASAQIYPSKPLRIIVPFAAGGTTDFLGRVVAQNLSEALGQPVIVENKPGAGTNIGADTVAKADPDGHTLLMGTPSIAVNPALFASMPYDWQKDLKPVTMVGFVPNLLVVHPSLPVKSVEELIAYGKANPGKLDFGSSGVGGAIHLSGELFKVMAGVEMLHVPYKGSAPAVTDLIGGRIALMFDNLPSSLPHVRAGKLRGIAVTSSSRSAAASDFPTVAESGLPGYEVLSWNGIFVPAGTSEEIVARLHQEIGKSLAKPEVKEQLASRGIEIGQYTPRQFGDFVKAEAEKWQGLVRKVGIKAQ